MALIDDIAQDVQQLFPKAPSDAIRRAIVRSARMFCAQTRWYRVAMSATLQANVKSYAVSGDPLLEVVDVPLVQLTDNNGNIVPVPNADPTSFNPNDKPSQPRWYAYIPEGQVTFHPTPNAAYAVTMTLAVQPREGVAEIPDALLVKWRQAIEDGAAWFLYQLPEPWNDHNLAEIRRLSFRAAVNNAKADVARGYQSGSVYGRRRAFIVG